MRTINESEAQWLRSLSANVDPTPPWTPDKRVALQMRNRYIVDLYANGVPVDEIAQHSERSTHAVRAVVAWARKTGTDVVRPRTVIKRNFEPYRRPLTDDERETLRRLDAAVPKGPRSGKRLLHGDEGKEFVAYVKSLRDAKVTLSTIADELGVSRQSVHNMMTVRKASA